MSLGILIIFFVHHRLKTATTVFTFPSRLRAATSNFTVRPKPSYLLRPTPSPSDGIRMRLINSSPGSSPKIYRITHQFRPTSTRTNRRMMITAVINIQGQANPPTFLRAAELSQRDKNFVVHILIIVSPAFLLATTALFLSTGGPFGVFSRLKKGKPIFTKKYRNPFSLGKSENRTAFRILKRTAFVSTLRWSILRDGSG